MSDYQPFRDGLKTPFLRSPAEVRLHQQAVGGVPAVPGEALGSYKRRAKPEDGDPHAEGQAHNGASVYWRERPLKIVISTALAGLRLTSNVSG